MTISCSSQKIQKNNWTTDIEFLKTELPAKHKDFFFKQDKLTFENGLDEIKSQQSELSDFEIAIKLQQLIATFGDSHTGIDWANYIQKTKILPIKAMWFKDGIYIIKTTKKNKGILGKKIKGINGTDVSVIVDKLSALFTKDNEAIIRKNIPELLVKIQLLVYFNIIKDDKIEFEIETEQGKTENQLVEVEPMEKENTLTLNLKSIPNYLQNERKYFWSKYIKESGIYYIQYNKCLSKEVELKYGNPENAENLPSFVEFENEIFSTIENKKINKFIFDMRSNGGGSSSQGTALVEKLSKIENINQKGKLYVIIGRRTFSSAIINTLDFKNNTNAIIVGEETSGKPNHYGDVRSFTLPNSKLKVSYSTKFFKILETDIGTIKPDIEIETSFNDFINGIDPIFDWIEKQ